MTDIRPVEPCPFYGTPCEYVPLAHGNADAARMEERAAIVAWLRANATLMQFHWAEPALATIEAGEHLQAECPRCCSNGQTYGPNSGEDIICPDCNGKGRK